MGAPWALLVRRLGGISSLRSRYCGGPWALQGRHLAGTFCSAQTILDRIFRYTWATPGRYVGGNCARLVIRYYLSVALIVHGQQFGGSHAICYFYCYLAVRMLYFDNI